MKKGNKRIFRIITILVKWLLSISIPLVLVLSSSKFFLTNEIGKNTPIEIFSDHLNHKIPALMDVYDIPGVSISIVDQGKIAWSKAYGYADLETGRKITTGTYLRVQSISKPITAWGVMKLVEQGKIKLDTPIKQYLRYWQFPESAFSAKQVTVRQLLTHTAGLSLGDFYNFYSPDDKIPSLEESLSKEAFLFQEAGKSFSYSNTGYNLLELLIEDVAGQDFSEYMQEEILMPLGMNNSSFVWSEDIQPPVPNGYDLEGNSIPVYIYPEKGSGGLFATVEDIARFMIAGMPEYSLNQHVLSPQSIAQLHTPAITDLGVYSLVFDSYGLGHYIETLSDDNVAVSHGGQGTGWMTHFHAVPETGDGIVILSNSQRSWPFIATLLTDWAEWSGLPAPGMSLILSGQKILWILISLLWFVTVWILWRLGEGILTKKRNFSPFSKRSLPIRVIQGSIAIILFGALFWSVLQDYLFISSVFPIASYWLGSSLLLFAIGQLFSALLPEKSACPIG